MIDVNTNNRVSCYRNDVPSFKHPDDRPVRSFDKGITFLQTLLIYSCRLRQQILSDIAI